MHVVRIQGGKVLSGKVSVSGAKNACLPIFAATLLTQEPCTIKNVPNISDVTFMGKILEHLGAQVEQLDDSTWRITAEKIHSKTPYDLVRKMRASVCLMGPLVARLGEATISMPGGCVIGQRPIDLHLKGLEKLGCHSEIENGYIHLKADQLKGAHLFMGGRYGSTVTGTANVIMAAVLTPGITIIDSAACEPEVEDLCRMLISMGAKIEGIGSHSLTITGVSSLHGCTHPIIGDRIEAGTFIIAGLITGGKITVDGMTVRHLGALIHKLEEMGAHIEIHSDTNLTVQGNPKSLKSMEIITLPHPGFPTDLQAQMCALATLIPGLSIITERIYPQRFMHVPELQRMGAKITIESGSAIIYGQEQLWGAPLMASDLRASASLYLAALAAKGESWIQRVYHLDRGYHNFEQKLSLLGADIQRFPAEVMPEESKEALLQ